MRFTFSLYSLTKNTKPAIKTTTPKRTPKTRPKLTRLQPLKEFGTFKKRKPMYGLE